MLVGKNRLLRKLIVLLLDAIEEQPLFAVLVHVIPEFRKTSAINESLFGNIRYP